MDERHFILLPGVFLFQQALIRQQQGLPPVKSTAPAAPVLKAPSAAKYRQPGAPPTPAHDSAVVSSGHAWRSMGHEAMTMGMLFDMHMCTCTGWSCSFPCITSTSNASGQRVIRSAHLQQTPIRSPKLQQAATQRQRTSLQPPTHLSICVCVQQATYRSLQSPSACWWPQLQQATPVSGQAPSAKSTRGLSGTGNNKAPAPAVTGSRTFVPGNSRTTIDLWLIV